jgi:NagD protein
LGYTTILTMSGVSTTDSLLDYAFKPDLIVNSVADIDIKSVLGMH